MLSVLTIGKLAALSEVSADTLRYYESEGLISPSRKSGSGYRVYDEDAVRRIRFIRHAQCCGFTLAEIGELLALRNRGAACCGDVRKRAIEKKLQLEAKVRTLKTMSRALDHLIAECDDAARPVDECPILAAFDQAIVPPPADAS